MPALKPCAVHCLSTLGKPLPPAGAAFSASHGGRLFKLEDVALASWLEWAAERGGFRIHRVTDRR